jgi:uncharacterized membrane protein
MSAFEDEQREGAAADHIEKVVRHLAHLRREETRRSPALQRLFERTTHTLGAPLCASVVLVAIAGWIGGNIAARGTGSALDTFPFPVLSVCSTVAAFIFTILILVTQRRSEQMAERRAQLTLQFAVLTELKVAKLIALIEEQRRDSEHLPSRADDEAAAMSKAAEPEEVLARMREIFDDDASRPKT